MVGGHYIIVFVRKAQPEMGLLNLTSAYMAYLLLPLKTTFELVV